MSRLRDIDRKKGEKMLLLNDLEHTVAPAGSAEPTHIVIIAVIIFV